MALACLVGRNLKHSLAQIVGAAVRAVHLDLDEETPHLKAAVLCANSGHLGETAYGWFVLRSYAPEALLLVTPEAPQWLNLVEIVWGKALCRAYEELRGPDDACARSIHAALVHVESVNVLACGHF